MACILQQGAQSGIYADSLGYSLAQFLQESKTYGMHIAGIMLRLLGFL
jgi:hypothetical protein